MKYLYLLCLSLLASGLFAQTGNSSVQTFDRPVPFQITKTVAADQFFDLDRDHELRHHYTHNSGQRDHAKYHQYYRGLRVLAGTTVMHLDQNGLYATTGHLATFSDVNVKGLIDQSSGEQLARLRVASQLGIGPQSSLELTAVTKAVANTNYPKDGGAYVPVFIYTLVNEELNVPLNQDVIVNANTGHIITTLSNIHTTMTTGTGDGHYHQDLTFPVDSISPNEFILRDLTRGKGVYAYDISNQDLPVTDNDNDWTYNSEYRESRGGMIDGYTGSVLFYDFMQEHLNRNSLDDNGVELIANMNRHNYVNAFWNGTSANFGNGDCERYAPLTVYEIVAHEYAHGLTDYTSDLIYYAESGAINEAISDIIGKAFEFYYDQEYFVWRIGNEIRRNQTYRYFRSMSDPHERAHPKFYEGLYWRFDEGDQNGVHSKSGLMNYWFYLLVEGGSDTNEGQYTFDVSPIGMDSALQLVYQLEAAYLTEDSDFRDAFRYTEMAAADLWGANSMAAAEAREAWLAVGVDESAVPTGGPGSTGKEIQMATRYGANFSSFRLCPNELLDMQVRFTNLSDTTLPAGLKVSGQLVFDYADENGENVLDTVVVEDTVLDRDIVSQDDFLVPVSFDYQGDVTFMPVTNLLVFSSAVEDTAVFIYLDNGFLFLDDVDEVDISFFDLELGNACQPDLNVVSDFWFFDIPRCAGNDGGEIEFTYTSADGMTNNTVSRSLELANNGSLFMSETLRDADLNSLGDLNGIRLDIAYKDQSGNIQPLFETNLGDYFTETIDEPAIETFDDESTARIRLGVDACAQCYVEYGSQQLVLGDTFQYTNLETCIPVADILNQDITQESDRVSTIRMCVETDGIENPYLVFDLLQNDRPRTFRRQNQYAHIVDVFYNDYSLLDEPISTTGNEMVANEIRLGNGFSGEIIFRVVSSDVATVIDNLGIVSGSPSNVGGLPAGDYGFRMVNPAQDRLEVFSDKTVPANTALTLFSAAGQQLRNISMQGLRASNTLDGVPAGLYFVTISDGSTFRWTGKLVKQ